MKGGKLRRTSQSECTGAHADESQLEKLPPLNCAGPKRVYIYITERVPSTNQSEWRDLLAACEACLESVTS